MTCHFYRDGAECRRPAEFHLLVDDDACSWSCEQHLPLAIEKLVPIDHHAFGDFCMLSTAMEPRLLWHVSTPEHDGFCWIDDDATRDLFEVRELVSVGGPEPHDAGSP